METRSPRMARSASITIADDSVPGGSRVPEVPRANVPDSSTAELEPLDHWYQALWNAWNPWNSWNMFTPKTLSFLRSLKRNNKREWFHERRDQYELHCRGPMIAVVERLADDFRIVRARDGGRSEGVAVSAVARHAIQRRQDAAEDQRRGDVSESRAWTHERRGALLRGRARMGLDRRRHVAARHVAAAAGARAHRRQPTAASRPSSRRRRSRSSAA